MPIVQVSLHPRGLHPTEAARAWHLHVEEGTSLNDVRKQVVNLTGSTPSVKAVWNAIHRTNAVRNLLDIPQSKMRIVVARESSHTSKRKQLFRSSRNGGTDAFAHAATSALR